MHQNSASLPQAVSVRPSRSMVTVWQFVQSRDTALLFLSLALLLGSTLDSGALGTIVKLCWLASVVVLTLINIGAALAAYMASLVIYSPLHFEGWVSPLQRPDNFALAIVLAGMLAVLFNSREAIPRFNWYILASLAFFLLHGAIFSQDHFAALFREILIPLLVCELSALIQMEERELHAFQNGIAVIGGYMGLVSILERVPAYDWILPPWIGNASLRPFDPYLEEWIGQGRSGGTILQPAWNGIMLTLIACFLLLRMRRGISWPVVISMLLCVAGSFFTYTRAVWLGLAAALLWFPGWCQSQREIRMRRIVLACVAAVFLLVAGGYASERLQDSNTIFYRFNLWGAALRLAASHPLTGVGFYNFGTAMSNVEQGFGSLIENQPDIKEEGAASHNTLLTVLVEFGVIGFFLYTTTFFKIVQRAINNARSAWGQAGAAWVLALFIIYFVNAMVVSAFEGAANVMFLGFLGVIAGARKGIV